MSRAWDEVHAEHVAMIEALAAAGPLLDEIADRIIQTLRQGGKVLIAGNGGSAADAQHIACELLGRFKLNRVALPVVALTTDSSTLTAVGNDLGYEQVFARQVEALAMRDDVVLLLSTSGNSPNILAALEAARNREATVIGLTGASGGQLAELADLALTVPANATDRIQEGHLLAYHYLCEQIEAAFAHEPSRADTAS